MPLKIRPFSSLHDVAPCRAIFDRLPDWFGIPSAVEDYLAGLADRTTWVACDGDAIMGFLALTQHTEAAAEIWVAAVDPDHHRCGVGRALVIQAEQYCRAHGLMYLQVKTLDATHPSEAYAATRMAWRALGFVPLETFPTLWDPSNPALQLVKWIPSHTAASRIDALGLEPHPEGGFFRETWRARRQLQLDDYPGPRHAGTSILFLLPHGVRSAWHRVRSDELWLWQGGDSLTLSMRDTREGDSRDTTVGPEQPQALVPGGVWQAAEPQQGPHGYTLVGCVVVPGFDFEDFEM